MSHSQFRRTKTYTETCMDESLRQAYDYWQDQPGSTRRLRKQCEYAQARTTNGVQSEIKLLRLALAQLARVRFWLRSANATQVTNIAGRQFGKPCNVFATCMHWGAHLSRCAPRSLRIQSTPSVPMQDFAPFARRVRRSVRMCFRGCG